MSKLYAFHETAKGHLHILKDVPCEDFSSSYVSNSGSYCIAVVADGHGSEACFRSAFGSQTAVTVTIECLKEFAETNVETTEKESRFYTDLLSNPRYQQMVIKKLTDTIISRWNDIVKQDYIDNPPTEEELTYLQADSEVTHIYGTTVIAALRLSQCLILLQQGDGRCEIVYADGTVDQPIPWDPRCEENVTTSLCDADASISIRSKVIDLNSTPVSACYLASDGVEDAYRDTYGNLGGSHNLMGGVHAFFKYVTCMLTEKGHESFESWLKEFLPEFSKTGKFSKAGSGDDVSVAGIVEPDMVIPFIDRFTDDIRIYALDEELFWNKDALRGKMRKHAFLEKKVEETKERCTEIQKKLNNTEEARKQMEQSTNELEAEIEQEKDDILGTESEYDLVKDILDNRKYSWKCIQKRINQFFEALTEDVKQYHYNHTGKVRMLEKQAKELEVLETDKYLAEQELAIAEREYSEAQASFNEYDLEFRRIETEIERIEAEIEQIKKNNKSVETESAEQKEDAKEQSEAYSSN